MAVTRNMCLLGLISYFHFRQRSTTCTQRRCSVPASLVFGVCGLPEWNPESAWDYSDSERRRISRSKSCTRGTAMSTFRREELRIASGGSRGGLHELEAKGTSRQSSSTAPSPLRLAETL